jgi:dephospho-CoA kinase
MTHLIGLTGQSGAGKSFAAKIFEENGFAVIDADECAREAVKPGSACLADIVGVFGEQILAPDKTLNRKALGAIVFANKTQLKKLNAIMHPFILDIVQSKIRELEALGYKFILLDAPTLFESKANDICDLIISIIANEDIRKARIAQRDGISEESIKKRFESQLPEQFFKENSDFFIKNNKSEKEFIEKTQEVAKEIIKYYENKG